MRCLKIQALKKTDNLPSNKKQSQDSFLNNKTLCPLVMQEYRKSPYHQPLPLGSTSSSARLRIFSTNSFDQNADKPNVFVLAAFCLAQKQIDSESKSRLYVVMAKGYWIITGTIHTPLGMVAYVNKLMQYVEKTGATFLVREMETDIREGEPGEVTVIIEFESKQAAETAYEDPEYQKLIALRRPHSDLSLTIVEELSA